MCSLGLFAQLFVFPVVKIALFYILRLLVFRVHHQFLSMLSPRTVYLTQYVQTLHVSYQFLLKTFLLEHCDLQSGSLKELTLLYLLPITLGNPVSFYAGSLVSYMSVLSFFLLVDFDGVPLLVTFWKRVYLI